MKSLPLRVISALFAVSLIGAVFYFFGNDGLLFVCFLVILFGAFEFQRIIFPSGTVPLLFRLLFGLGCVALLYCTIFYRPLLWLFWGVWLSVYLTGGLWLLRDRVPNDKLLLYLADSALGFVYCVFMPSFALGLIQLPKGELWFLLLIFVTAASDTFAFFGGLLFGRTKLMPAISPNKTVAGSLFGLLGAILMAIGLGHFILPNQPAWTFGLIGLTSGWLGQNGDLFESLLKRVGGVKDSGAIMPGHGGVLDRLDAVYFSAPIVYAAALVFS